MNNELYHHGILGQKWGVRNGPPYPLEDNENFSEKRGLTDTQKKILVGATVAIAVGVGAYFAKNYIDEYGTTTIKAGTTFQHMMRNTDKTLNSPLYATYLKNDNKKYSTESPFSKEWNYKSLLKSDQSYKIISNKKAEKIYDSIFNGKYPSYERFITELGTNPDWRGYNLTDSDYNKFFNALKERGYDGFRDVLDQKAGVKSPVVLINKIGNISMTYFGEK